MKARGDLGSQPGAAASCLAERERALLAALGLSSLALHFLIVLLS